MTVDTGARAVDVIVIGSGVAGCAAAISAAEHGASVLVLEKESPETAGGNTRVSGGAWFTHDDPEGIAEYLRALSARSPLPEAIVRTWAEKTREVDDWMRSIGADVQQTAGAFLVEYPELPGSDAYGGYRSVTPQLGNQHLYRAMTGAIIERGIKVEYEQRVVELLQDDSGTVHGVVTQDGSRIEARGGVVLATGGFEGDPELVREHLGLEDVVVWGSAAAAGDGLRLAQAAGADLWHMDNMMTVTGVCPPGERHGFFSMPLYSRAWIWVDVHGKRFVDESRPAGHGQALIGGEYVIKPDRPMFVVFGERMKTSGPICPSPQIMGVGWKAVVEGYVWSADNETEIAQGWVHRADTVAELAERIDVPADALGETIAEYDRACEAGIDNAFARPAGALEAIGEGPFYAYYSAPLLAWTNGGPRRDERARVLREDASPIDGLYAAGAVSSTYSWAKDGGFHIADAVVFGRIAGEAAARRSATHARPARVPTADLARGEAL